MSTTERHPIVDLYRAGVIDAVTTAKAALLTLGFTEDEAHRIVEPLSGCNIEQRRLWTDAEKAEFTDLYLAGASRREIAAHFGCRETQVLGLISTLKLHRSGVKA